MGKLELPVSKEKQANQGHLVKLERPAPLELRGPLDGMVAPADLDLTEQREIRVAQAREVSR